MYDSQVLSRDLLALCCVAVVSAIFIRRHAEKKLHDLEPELVQSKVPYVGHLIGMIVYGGRYVTRIACQHSPIFTLPMPGSRMYIVTDPSLAAIVQKTKTLSFNPVIPKVTERILGLDEQTVKILSENIGRDKGPHGFYPEVRDLVYSTMTPGHRLEELTDAAADAFRRHLNVFAHNLEGGETASTVDFLVWTQHMVTLATAEFLYGPHNPIAKSADLERSFWDFDHGLGRLLVFADLMPYISAYKAYRGREAVVSALKQYFKDGNIASCSYLIRNRFEIANQHGMSMDGIARSELSFLFAGIVNTAITSFWLILHIFGDECLLQVVREEISYCEELHPTQLAEKCPVFLSAFRETLRLGSDNSSTRLVTSDTVLADTYRLAEQSVVQISGAALHKNKDFWGPDAESFDAYRFMPDRTKEMHIHPSTFRAFGGGTTICPGRHFAAREILYFVALVVQTFDIRSADGDNIILPARKDNVLPVHILEPAEQVYVRFRMRNKDLPRQKYY